MTGQEAFAFNDAPLWAQDAVGQAWWSVHCARPEIATEFIRLARQWREANPTKRVGAKAIFEVLRWNTSVGVIPHDGQPFRLNNKWTPLYARWAMSTCPDLADAFETRRRIAA